MNCGPGIAKGVGAVARPDDAAGWAFDAGSDRFNTAAGNAGEMVGAVRTITPRAFSPLGSWWAKSEAGEPQK